MPQLTSSTIRRWIANTNPTANDDAQAFNGYNNNGFEVGSWWVNTTTNILFECIDNTVGAAVWRMKPSQQSGIFTPELRFGGQATGIIYAINGQEGIYSQIGDLIYINTFLQLTDKGSQQGNASIAGLPFVSRTNIKPKGLQFISLHVSLSLTYTNAYGRINPDSSVINLIESNYGLSSSIQNLTDSNFSNDSVIQVDGFYFI